MAIGYRAVLQIDDAHDAVRVAGEQVRRWLEKKARRSTMTFDLVDWAGTGVFDLSGTARLTMVTHADDRDSSRRQLLRFSEENPAGSWVVSVVAHSLPKSRSSKQIIMIELEKLGAEVDDALIEAKPPALVKLILEACQASDHETRITPSPTIIRRGETDEVVSAILDQGRQASVVVGMTPGELPDENWVRAIEGLTRDSLGASTAFAIAEDAVEELYERLPRSHAVSRGGVRTYLPRVDFSDPGDSIRHRVLTPATFIRSIRDGRVGGSLPAVHAETARRHLVEAEPSSELRRTIDVLTRDEVELKRQSAAGKMRELRIAKPDLSTPEIKFQSLTFAAKIGASLKSFFLRWLGKAEINLESIRQLDSVMERTHDEYEVAKDQIQELFDEKTLLKNDVDRLRNERDDAEIEATIDAGEARAAQHLVSRLQARLRQLEDYESLYSSNKEDVSEGPRDFDDLLDQLDYENPEMPMTKYVQFWGDRGAALDINKRDPLGRIAAKMWDYVLVLRDYAELKTKTEFAGSVHQYLMDPEVQGAKCSPQRHASRESESVMSNSRLMAERTFAVPRSVSENGLTPMVAHFKPTHTNTYAPRLYYYDDTAMSGKIYIGYIGRHLNNSKSN